MSQYGMGGARIRSSPLPPPSPATAGQQRQSSANEAGGTGAGASDAGDAGLSGGDGVQHKRVYQACIPCRRRKVRCDLGSVDNPRDPPCVRCRRESKECFFSATRRKRKADGSADGFEDDEYIIRNGRKRLLASGSLDSPPLSTVDRRMYNDVPLTPGGSTSRNAPLKRPDGPGRDASQTSLSSRRSAGEFDGEANTPLENFEARTVMRREVYGQHDALDLLYKAATDSPHKLQDTMAQSRNDEFRPRNLPRHQHDVDSRRVSYGADGIEYPRKVPRQDHQTDQPIDPELTKRDVSSQPGYTEALRAWTRFRFVRAGWFTAQEAIDYIDYYYEYLSPLTPISPPTFRSPATHLTLLTEEPILTVTLLTIASRYRCLPGTGGHCRSHAIHEQLWTFLRGMIERVIWGQEAFGGGFCGSGADESQTSSTAPWRGLRKGSLRTLGTIESLMILTEWHPRALHFPPAEATDELMLPSFDPRDTGAPDEDGNFRPSVGGRRIESWLEPAWRSDRMCWMLLTSAMGLAYELGVFDDIDELLATEAITRPEYEEESYRLRAYRIKRLILIYLSQLAGRLGWTNMVPDHLRKSDPAISNRRRPTSVEGTTPGTNPSSSSNAFNYIPDLELDDQIIHCWAGISNAMHMGNEKLFKSRKHTTDIIQNGKYITLLKEFQPLLKDWWKEFERLRLPPYIRHILTIEFEYVRIYVNSLSLQAVVERCTTNAGGTVVAGQNGGQAGSTGAQLSPQTQNYYGKLPLGQLGGFGVADQEYIKEVVDGSRNLLRTVVEGLLPGDYLKHAPVRTYFRIISGAMFLLKTFALGAPKSDVELSIGLMDRTVDALRTCVVDDVHLGSRYASLLESLTSRLRNRFIHAPPLGALQASSSDSRSPNAHQDDGGIRSGAGGLGVQQTGGVDNAQAWVRLRETANAPEQSSTPANISATPFDLTAGSFPYPTGSATPFGPSTPAANPAGMDTSNTAVAAAAAAASTNGGANQLPDNLFGDAADWNNPGSEMWYLPTGPAFFQNMGESSSVAMTAEGVNVGGIDLLDYMAMDQVPFMDGSGF